MNRRTVYLAVSLTVVATLGLWFGPRVYRSLQADSLPDMVALAPADSTMIMAADLGALRSSAILQKLQAAAPSPTFDKDYTDFVAATGFDYQRDLDRVVMAVRSEPVKQTIIFAEGHFDRQKIGQYVLRTGKSENHNGHTVYMMPSTTPGQSVYLTFLEGNRLAMSYGNDLSPVLAGAHAPLDPALDQRISRVSGSPFFAVVKVPDTSSAPTGSAANPMAAFLKLRWVSFAARPEASDVIFSIEGECDSPEQAQKVAAGLEFFRTLMRGELADPKARGEMTDEQSAAINRFLTAANIINEAGRVRLLLTVTPDMIPAPNANASRAINR
jgi:hypothetical protein